MIRRPKAEGRDSAGSAGTLPGLLPGLCRDSAETLPRLIGNCQTHFAGARPGIDRALRPAARRRTARGRRL